MPSYVGGNRACILVRVLPLMCSIGFDQAAKADKDHPREIDEYGKLCLAVKMPKMYTERTKVTKSKNIDDVANLVDTKRLKENFFFVGLE